MPGIRRRTRFNLIIRVYFIFVKKATTTEIHQWLVHNKIPILCNMTKGMVVSYLREHPNIVNTTSGEREAIWVWEEK